MYFLSKLYSENVTQGHAYSENKRLLNQINEQSCECEQKKAPPSEEAMGLYDTRPHVLLHLYSFVAKRHGANCVAVRLPHNAPLSVCEGTTNPTFINSCRSEKKKFSSSLSAHALNMSRHSNFKNSVYDCMTRLRLWE